VCVEADRRAAEAIHRNAEGCGLGDRVEVRVERVESALPRLPPAAFALVFLDPPYATGPADALARLGPLLAPGGRAVAEHDRRSPPAERFGALALADRRSYGDTGISIYRLG
jgi:16S rRNA (guanine966-N2)-methyltransferase